MAGNPAENFTGLLPAYQTRPPASLPPGLQGLGFRVQGLFRPSEGLTGCKLRSAVLDRSWTEALSSSRVCLRVLRRNRLEFRSLGFGVEGSNLTGIKEPSDQTRAMLSPGL